MAISDSALNRASYLFKTVRPSMKLKECVILSNYNFYLDEENVSICSMTITIIIITKI
jgi:hypothetical protein